jgi:hypothetical protein
MASLNQAPIELVLTKRTRRSKHMEIGGQETLRGLLGEYVGRRLDKSSFRELSANKAVPADYTEAFGGIYAVPR